MLFFICVLATLGLAALVGFIWYKDDDSIAAAFGGFSIAIIMCGALSTLIIAISCGASMENAEHHLINTETYEIAKGSTFENKSGVIKFVSKNATGTVESQRIYGNVVDYDTTNITKVEVQTFDVVNSGLLPWVMDTHKHVRLK